MPAVQHDPGLDQTAHKVPPNPNVGSHAQAPSQGKSPAVEPAPPVVQAASHRQVHILPRRFLGPIPHSVATSSKNQVRKDRLRTLRNDALRELLGGDNLGIRANGGRRDQDGRSVVGEAEEEIRAGARRLVHTFRVHKSSLIDSLTQDLNVDVPESDANSSSDSEEEAETVREAEERRAKKALKRKRKKKKAGRGLGGEVWVGGSFDIGREFQNSGEKTGDGEEAEVVSDSRPGVQPEGEATVEAVNGKELANVKSPSASTYADGGRPDGPSRRRTEDDVEELVSPKKTGRDDATFVTAKTKAADNKTFVTANTKPPHPHAHFADTDAGPSLPRPQPSRQSTGVSTADTFVTAHTEPGSDSDDSFLFSPTPVRVPPSAPTSDDDHLSPGKTLTTLDTRISRASSMAPLVSKSRDASASPTRAVPTPRSPASGSDSIKAPKFPRLKSALRRGHKPQPSTDSAGAPMEATPGKTVQFPPNPASEVHHPEADAPDRVRHGAEPPADPAAVLRRSGEAVAGTSADTEVDHVLDTDDFMPGGVVMRDRVLVRVARHRDTKLREYDQVAQRRSPCYRIEAMEEYIVGMTMTTIDFYQDFRFGFEERLRGHKRLAFSIPLAPPTNMTVFNDVDMTLSIVCRWSTLMRHTRNLVVRMKTSNTWGKVRESKTMERLGGERAEGSGVFLLQFAERSRARDWHWYISGQLQVQLPKVIDVGIPALAEAIRMPIPEEAASTTVNRADTIEMLWKLVLGNTDNQAIIRALGAVPKMELAWKGPGARLDWIAYSTTITGKKREWALLASFAASPVDRKARVLQVRDATHHAHAVRLQDGTSLDEPAGVEGYLHRMKSEVAPKASTYVSTHNGFVFVSGPNGARPPLQPKRAASTPADVFPDVYAAFRESEARRMAAFMAHCDAVLDMRAIESVQLVKPVLATPHVPGGAEGPSAVSPDSTVPVTAGPPIPTTQLRRSNTTILDKEGTKEQRTFMITLRTGQQVKFEAQAPDIAAEWVSRLSALVAYWTIRMRVDARAEMDAVGAHTSGAAVVGSPLDVGAEMLLNGLWNWCVIDGCRPVTMSGQVFIKHSKWHGYRSTHLVLASGSLIAFRINSTTGLMPRESVYPLFGAYVYTGSVAQDELRESANESLFNPPARVYADGLQTTDAADDTVFVVRLSWPTGRFAASQPWDEEDGGKKFTPPGLGGDKPDLAICRARSMLERDRWVWAINAEKERLARQHPRDEEVLRNYGTLPQHPTLSHSASSRTAASGLSGFGGASRR